MLGLYCAVAVVFSAALCHACLEKGKRQKAEGRRQKAEGRRQKAEGRRQKAEGRRQEQGNVLLTQRLQRQ